MSLIPCDQVLTTDKIIRSWGPMAGGDVCAPLEPWAQNLLTTSLQAAGSFGGTVLIELSNDGVTWVTAKDLNGVDLMLTGPGLWELSSAARFIRPNPGANVIAATIILCMRG